MTLAVIEFLQEMGQTAQADQMLRKLLLDPKQAQRPTLWRLASTLAHKRDMPAQSIECLEKALDLEFRGADFQSAQGTFGQIENLPHRSEVVDLQQVRQEYAQLLTHYQALADAMVALKIEPPAAFLPKVVRTADRWRALDPNSTDVCQAAAQILQRLGDRDLGFDYLTTPIGQRPNEAEPWVDLASTLCRKGELKLADRAYRAAFEAEPTNAQILWDRAQNLHQAGENQGAQRLFRQLAEGSWPQRFQGIQTQARLRIQMD